MNKQELHDRIGYCQRELVFLQEVQTNCTRCKHYVNDDCLKFGQKVPQEFVAVGCDEWEFDEVPF